jgi:hypothetical protein
LNANISGGLVTQRHSLINLNDLKKQLLDHLANDDQQINDTFDYFSDDEYYENTFEDTLSVNQITSSTSNKDNDNLTIRSDLSIEANQNKTGSTNTMR